MNGIKCLLFNKPMKLQNMEPHFCDSDVVSHPSNTQAEYTAKNNCAQLI